MQPTPSFNSSPLHRRPYVIRGGRASEDDALDLDTEAFDLEGDRPTSAIEMGPLESTQAEATPAAVDEPLMAPREIGPGTVLRGRYMLEKVIGVGGTSTVFSALDRHRASGSANSLGTGAGGTGRIAIKVLRSAAGGNEARIFRMEREFRQMQRLTHAGIARVFDLDREDDLWFITLELLEGEPLHKHMRSGGITEAAAFGILTQCAEALSHAHEHGIVHGDLKPSNVFVTRDGSIRLLDFGSAPDLETRSEDPATQRFAATPPYASPETLQGRGVEPRDDLFSLGCIAYELLTGGTHPFSHQSSLDARRQNLRAPYVSSIRPRHFAVIAKALAWERSARPSSAREFLHAFLASEFARETAVEAPAAERVIPPAQPAAAEDVDWITLPTLETKRPAVAPPAPAVQVAPLRVPEPEDAPAKAFSGFVPEEMLMRVDRNIAPSVDNLHVSGMTERPRWVRRASFTIFTLAALLALAMMVESFNKGAPAPAAVAAPQPQAATPPLPPHPEPATTKVEPAPPIAAAPEPPRAIPSAPGEVSFQSATVNVGRAQSMAVVNVTRDKSTRGPAPVAWSTQGETAKAGIHYESVDSKVTRFNDGQSVRSLFIPLKFDPAEAGSRPARSFIVKLEKAAGGPALGAITQARIIIEGIE